MTAVQSFEQIRASKLFLPQFYRQFRRIHCSQRPLHAMCIIIADPCSLARSGTRGPGLEAQYSIVHLRVRLCMELAITKRVRRQGI
jgi:hypothetical protein